MIILAVLNIILSLYGVKRAYNTKSMILFVWLIVFYYSITSIVELIARYDVDIEYRMTYALNMTLCLLAFLASDYCFNRKHFEQIDCSELEIFKPFLIVIEVVFWISIILTYLELSTQDYATYVNEGGQAGWAQALFEIFSCIIVYFIYKKSWFKVVAAGLLVVGMVASTGVRSLLYFVLLPVVLYYINHFVHSDLDIKSLIKIVSPMVILMGVSVIIVNMLRFGEVELPETILTDIFLKVLQNGGYPEQGFNSLLHYIAGFTPPFVNTLNKLGLDLPQLGSYLTPSIPRLNDIYTAEYNPGYCHMPATIFNDFYMSFGYYGALWAFVVFSWLKVLCDFLQKNIASFFALSSVFGWHIYMLLRGACDGASSGISYAILMALLLYLLLFNYKKKNERKIERF